MTRWAILILVVSLMLVACASAESTVPAGDYWVYPMSDQTITPGATLEVEGRHFTMRDPAELTPSAAPDTPPPSSPLPPTLTPTIPPTPTPDTPGACLATVATTVNLRVRSAPRADASVVGALDPGSRVTVTAVEFVDVTPLRIDEWAAITRVGLSGWAAARFNNQDYLVYDNSLGCLSVRFPEPEARMWDGPQLLAGEGGSVVQNYLVVEGTQRYDACKSTDDIHQVCQALKDRATQLGLPFEWTCRTYRFDRPDRPYNAEDHWRKIAPALPLNCDYYEIENEHAPEPQDYEEWINFSQDMARIIERERGAALLAFSFGPGIPDYPLWESLKRFIEWAEARGPAPNGKWHGIALHAAAYITTPIPGMDWLNSVHHTPDRVLKLARDVVLANTGYDLRATRIAWRWTELGGSDGYGGDPSWTYNWNCREVADMYQTTNAILENYAAAWGMNLGFHFWSFGQIGRWTSHHNCSERIWTGVVSMREPQPPPWVESQVRALVEIFNLQVWDIKIESADHAAAPDSDRGDQGANAFNEHYFGSTLYFDERLEPDEDGIETVLHEVLHLILAEMRNLIRQQLIDQLDLSEQRNRAQALYDRCEERAITVLARGLARQPAFRALLLAPAPVNGDSLTPDSIP